MIIINYYRTACTLFTLFIRMISYIYQPNRLLIAFLTVFSFSCKTSVPPASPPDLPEEPVEETRQEPEIYVSPYLEYQEAAPRMHDLLHTRLDISFDFNQHQVLGKAYLELQPYFYPQQKVQLNARQMSINQVLKRNGEQADTLSFSYDGQVITIDLGRKYEKGENYFLEIDYVAHPDQVGNMLAEEGNDNQGLYFINTDSVYQQYGFHPDYPVQIWTQGETSYNSAWFPTIDHPNERCTQEMYITVPEKFSTLSNGRLVSSTTSKGLRTDYWQMNQEHAPYLFMLAVGEYAVSRNEWEGVPLYYYVEEAYAGDAEAIFGETPKMMALFTELFGIKYPWSKYAQVPVREFISGAMENTTATVFFEEIQRTANQINDYQYDDIIAHELAHHWFGNYVTCESWANLTLNEALASYSEYLWAEHRYGKTRASMTLWDQHQEYFEEAVREKKPLIRYHYEDEEDLFDAHSYQKGSAVLHMLRHYLGDEAFFKGLQRYLKKNALQSVEIDELRLAFESVSGLDLNWFFDQWFLTPGHPSLQVIEYYEEGNLYLEITQTQDLEASGIYYIPLKIAMLHGDKVQYYSVTLTQSEEIFSFEMDQSPDAVMIDPDAQLLAEINYPRSDSSYRYQYYHAESYQHRQEAISHFSTADSLIHNTELFLAALNDSSWYIRQEAVRTLSRYTGNRSGEVRQQLEQTFKNDPEALVRADALLAVIQQQGYQEDLVAMGLNDSAYSVQGAALFSLQRSPGFSSLKRIEEYEEATDVNLVIPVAEYYVTNNTAKKNTWFEAKMKEVNYSVLYYLLNYYGQYLLNNVEMQQDGIARLFTYAEHYPRQSIRLIAFRTLQLFSEQPAVAIRLQEIIDQEEDAEFKKRLQQAGAF